MIEMYIAIVVIAICLGLCCFAAGYNHGVAETEERWRNAVGH